VRVTTGAGLEPGVAAAVPLEEVVTGAEEEEYEGEEPADEAPVETPPLDPAPLALPYAAAAPAAPAPAPTRCFGLTCLVTWIVRLITFVWIRGLAATGADFWLLLRARPVSPPKPTIAAPAATRVLTVFPTSAHPLVGFHSAVSGGDVQARVKPG
jgi:hypothetical protein